MAKNHVLPRYLFWAAVCLCGVYGSGVLGAGYGTRTDGTRADWIGPMDAANPRLPVESLPSAFHHLRGIYMAEIGVKEATGRNDGSRVAEYLRYCGLDEGYAWCAAFVSWCHGQAGYAAPRNAWSPALFPKSRTIWNADNPVPGSSSQPVPRPGDVFGIYYTNLGRIAHVGFVDRWEGTYCITVEGNTGPDNSPDTRSDPANPIRAGPAKDGVYRKRRPIRTIRAVARWTALRTDHRAWNTKHKQVN